MASRRPSSRPCKWTTRSRNCAISARNSASSRRTSAISTRTPAISRRVARCVVSIRPAKAMPTPMIVQTSGAMCRFYAAGMDLHYYSTAAKGGSAWKLSGWMFLKFSKTKVLPFGVPCFGIPAANGYHVFMEGTGSTKPCSRSSIWGCTNATIPWRVRAPGSRSAGAPWAAFTAKDSSPIQ